MKTRGRLDAARIPKPYTMSVIFELSGSKRFEIACDPAFGAKVQAIRCSVALPRSVTLRGSGFAQRPIRILRA